MKIRVVIGAAAALGLASCAGPFDTSGAEASVMQFHRELDAGGFAEIYSRSAPAMKTSTTAAHLTALLEAVHRKLGKTVSATKQGSSVFAGTNGTSVNLTYATKYEHGDANETFVFQGSTGQLQLAGYNINSEALILN